MSKIILLIVNNLLLKITLNNNKTIKNKIANKKYLKVYLSKKKINFYSHLINYNKINKLIKNSMNLYKKIVLNK